jgi:hypothetical protein
MAYDKITLPGSGLVFNNVYSFDTSLYPGYKSEIIAAEHFFQEHFTNSIQLNIKFDLGTSQNGVALGTNGAVNGIDPGSPGGSIASISTVVNSLKSPDASPLQFITQTGYLADPSNGQGFYVPLGLARVWGLSGSGTGGVNAGVDIDITLNSYYLNNPSSSWQFNGDVASFLEHEISENGVGRVQGLHLNAYKSFPGAWYPLDLFRYTANGYLDFSGGQDGLPTYFGYATGAVGAGNIVPIIDFSHPFHIGVDTAGVWDQLDFADWDGSIPYDAFGANSVGKATPVSDTDLRVLQILGWTRWYAPTPTLALSPSSDSGVKGDGITNVTNPVITGTGEAGDVVILTASYDPSGGLIVGAQPVVFQAGIATVASNGAWSTTISLGSANRGYTITATESDALHGGSLPSAPLALSIDTTPPSAPGGLALSPASQTGQGSNITAVTTPVITGHDGAGGAFGDTITLYDGTTSVGTGTVTFGGGWSIKANPLAIGGHSLTAKETDAAGNTSPASAAFSLTITTSSLLTAAPTSSNLPVAHGVNLLASGLFTAGDSGGGTIAQYDFWNSGSGGGHWALNGAAQGANQDNYVAASQLAQTTYQSGSGVDTLWVRVSDGSAWSAWSQAFTVTAPIDTGPTVAPLSSNFKANHNQSFAASSLFTYSDPFGSPATQYDVWDVGSGGAYFVLSGGLLLTANQDNIITPVQLAQLAYQSGSTPDTFWIRANDGTVWGAWSSFTVTPPIDTGPVVMPNNPNVSAAHGQSFAASSLFTNGDPFGDPAIQYDVWDAGTGGGHFVSSGLPLATQQDNIIAAGFGLPQLLYQSGSGTDTVWIRANDGSGWGGWSSFTVTAPIDTGPVVAPINANLTVPHGNNLAASSLFTYSDPFGSAATQYDVWNAGSGGGHFALSGTALSAGQDNIVTAAQLAQLSYQPGSGTDTLWIRANDGTVWGTWSAGFTITAPIDTGPVVTSVQTITTTSGQILPASSLLTDSDPFGDPIEQYDFWDTGSGSACFLLNNQILAANQDNYVTAAQLPQTTYLSGSGTDTLWVRVNEGGQWSPWSPSFTVGVPVQGVAAAAPSPTLGVSNIANAANGEVIGLSSLVTIAGGGIPVDDGAANFGYSKLELWDSNGTAAGGQFVVNGVAQTGGHEIDVSPVDVASTVFDAATSAGTDELWARLLQNDGTITPWQPFSVTVPEPILTVMSYPNGTPGEQIPLSTLLTISDVGHLGYQKFELWDSNGTDAGGQFVIGGVPQTGGHEIDVSPTNVANTVFKVGSTGATDTLWARLFQNDGTLTPWQQFTVKDPLTVAGGATLEITSAYAGAVTFGGSSGTLQLDNSASFSGTVAGMAGEDTLDLRDMDFTTVQTPLYVGDDFGGTLTVTAGSHTANIALLGSYLASTFITTGDGHGGTTVTEAMLTNDGHGGTTVGASTEASLIQNSSLSLPQKA